MMNYEIEFSRINKVIRKMEELHFWFEAMEEKGIPKERVAKLVIREFDKADKEFKQNCKD